MSLIPLVTLSQGSWIAIMKGAIAKCGSLFNNHRMMRRYRVEAYVE